MTTYESTIEGLIKLSAIDDYKSYSGYNLELKDFENGSAIEGGTPQAKSIMVSWNGYDPFGVNEDDKFTKLVETAVIFAKIPTAKGANTVLKTIMNNLNDGNKFIVDDENKTLQVLGATPIKYDKISSVFAIELMII